jgi:hypothetical protein
MTEDYLHSPHNLAFFFVNTVKIPAGILASFPCKLNTFRKRVREAVTSK